MAAAGAGGAAAGAARGKVIVISGPTASGKTALGLALAGLLGGEIVSADSVQVNRGMDVGSAKTPPADRQGVPHHMLDIMDPTEECTAGDFYEAARAATADVLSRGRVPIVVGGTGMYLRWFLYGKPQTPRSTPEIGARVATLVPASFEEESASIDGNEDHGWTRAVRILSEAGDPVTAAQLKRNDWYRLRRALEIVLASGRPRTDFPCPHEAAPSENLGISPGRVDNCTDHSQVRHLDYDFCCYFLSPSRLDLYKRIDRRCEEMLAGGLLREAAWLLDNGILPDSNSPSRAIGYRQAMDFLQQRRESSSSTSEQEILFFLQTFQQASRNFARRQITWFRGEPLFCWIDPSEENVETQIAAAFHEPAAEEQMGRASLAVKERTYEEGKKMKFYRTSLTLFTQEEERSRLRAWLDSTQRSSARNTASPVSVSRDCGALP